MRQTNRNGQKKQRRLSALVILALIFTLTFAGLTAARYVTQIQKNQIAEAADFYFSSDLLRETSSQGSGAVYYIDPQEANFAINLYNYADSKRITASDIKCEVTVTGGSASPSYASLTGSTQSAAAITITPDGGTADSQSPEADPAASGSSDTASRQITVTASSSSPFSRTLTATFITALGNTYSIEDESGNIAAVLTMTCTDDAKDITLLLPSGVIPDATDDRVKKSEAATDQYTFASPGRGVYSLVLLKSDSRINLTSSGISFATNIDLTQTN